jgi:tRNA U34 2-thiouridine synthase MnmA/TrmU
MKAITLISGGLDSILAARLIKEQGIDVIPLYFKIPFCHIRPQAYLGKDLSSFVNLSLGEKLKEIEIGEEFLKLTLNPRFGFGSTLNPCIDCKIFMLSRSKELIPKLGADFIVTGEVLGQRPMSQHRRALETIEKESGLSGLLLRPLSAKNLKPTIPEEKGWVSRDKLLNFSGRTRKPQIELARHFHILGYPNASGGCLLTDKEFSLRLKDLIDHKELNLFNAGLLKIGRHFRLSKKAKLIVGRNEEENMQLEIKALPGNYLFMPDREVAGPTCLGVGEFNKEEIDISAGIACRYCDSNTNGQKITCKDLLKDKALLLDVLPLCEYKFSSFRI